MDLLDIRQKFIEFSGRYDLATTSVDDWDTDAGADFFINAGQRFLDRRFEIAKTYGRRFDAVVAGAYYQIFQNCRAISEVWCNSSEERWQLVRYDKQTIRDNFSGLVSSIGTGPPKFYTPLSLRAVDATDMTSLGTFLDYVKTDDDGTYNGILFVPPTDGSYVIETIGKFFHSDLSDNDDENYWTTVSPDTLIKAALYQLEISYRNTEGAKDWLNAITIEGRDMEFDLVEEESNEGRVIE